MGAVKCCAAALALVSAPAGAEPVARWSLHVAEAAQRFGLPPAWIWRVVAIESGGQTERAGRPIRSSKGAIGLMQLMPSTWGSMRARLGLGADPDDPRDNIMAGTAYLRLMYDRFGYPGLFAAYNAGPGRYAEVLAGRAQLPSETATYLALATGKSVRPAVRVRALASNPPDRLFFAASADVAGSGLFVAVTVQR